MSKIYFSPGSWGFYPESLKKEYLASNSWPKDLVEVSEEDYAAFVINPRPAGKTLIFDKVLMWADFQPSREALISSEGSWIRSELDRIREELEKVQDSDPKATGSVSDWRAYRKAIRIWSEDINFPNKQFRPTSPDFKE